MTHRISVSTKIQDARALHYRKTLKGVFPHVSLDKVAAVAVYTVDAGISRAECERAAVRLTNPVIEEYVIGKVPAPENHSYAIEIGYLAGVTDNVGHTARETIEDLLGRKFKEGESVYSSLFLFLSGALTKENAEMAARELHNPLIQRATVYPAGTQDFPVIVPRVELHERTAVDKVDPYFHYAELSPLRKKGWGQRLSWRGSRGHGPNTASTRYSPTRSTK